MIKVNDVSASRTTSKTGKSVKTGTGASFSSYLNEMMKTDSAPVNPSSAISITDAIFAAQTATDEEEKQIRKKLIKRGNALLDKLEVIRDGLLAGYISKDELIELSRMIKEKQFETQDEKLKEIIAEIELRVEVELAKLTK